MMVYYNLSRYLNNKAMASYVYLVSRKAMYNQFGRSAKLASAASVALLFIAGCDTLSNKADHVLSNCENIRPDIIEMTEKDRASRGYSLVAIYEPTEVSKSDKELNCRGKASWSDNDETPITYKQFIDREGQIMLQYQVPE